MPWPQDLRHTLSHSPPLGQRRARSLLLKPLVHSAFSMHSMMTTTGSSYRSQHSRCITRHLTQGEQALTRVRGVSSLTCHGVCQLRIILSIQHLPHRRAAAFSHQINRIPESLFHRRYRSIKSQPPPRMHQQSRHSKRLSFRRALLCRYQPSYDKALRYQKRPSSRNQLQSPSPFILKRSNHQSQLCHNRLLPHKSHRDQPSHPPRYRLPSLRVSRHVEPLQSNSVPWRPHQPR